MAQNITQDDIDKLTEAMNEIEHGAQASLRNAGQTLFDSPITRRELQKVWDLHEAVKQHWHVLNARRNAMREKLVRQQSTCAQ